MEASVPLDGFQGGLAVDDEEHLGAGPGLCAVVALVTAEKRALIMKSMAVTSQTIRLLVFQVVSEREGLSRNLNREAHGTHRVLAGAVGGKVQHALVVVTSHRLSQILLEGGPIHHARGRRAAARRARANSLSAPRSRGSSRSPRSPAKCSQAQQR